MFGLNYSGDLILCLFLILLEVFIFVFKSDNLLIEMMELMGD